jgi:ribosome maturation factor RimP
MANIEEKVENLIKEKVKNIGYSIYDVQYVKEGQEYYLRIFIEKENGTIDLNDCEKVNNEINDLLDKADYIKEQYFLEVSSTGLEKVLRKDKHLQDNIGEEISIKLFKPIEIENDGEEVNNKKSKSKKNRNNKIKEIQGKLESFDENEIVIELENKRKLNVERNNISQIKTVFDWDSI